MATTRDSVPRIFHAYGTLSLICLRLVLRFKFSNDPLGSSIVVTICGEGLVEPVKLLMRLLSFHLMILGNLSLLMPPITFESCRKSKALVLLLDGLRQHADFISCPLQPIPRSFPRFLQSIEFPLRPVAFSSTILVEDGKVLTTPVCIT